MSTGPEHYHEAERLESLSHGQEPARALVTLAQAQVCATLALDAATAMAAPVEDCEPGMSREEYEAWYRTCGTRLGTSARGEATA